MSTLLYVKITYLKLSTSDVHIQAKAWDPND